MRKLLLLILLLPLFAKAQNTVTLPTPTTAYTPQFRYYGAANDTLKSVYMFSGSVYNQIYTATQIAKLFRTPNSIFTRRMDSLFALSAKLTGNNVFTGNQTVNGDVTSTGTITGLNITATNNVSGNYGIFTTNLDVGNQVSAVNLSLVAGANRTNFQYGNFAGGITGMKIYTPAVSSDAVVIVGSNIYGNNVPFLKAGDVPSDSTFNARVDTNTLIKRENTVYAIGDSKIANGTYVNKLDTLLGSGWNVVNMGISGALAYGTNVRFADVTNGTAKYVIIRVGVNDISFDRTAAQIIADIQAMATKAHNAGIYVIVPTITPFGNNAIYSGAREIVRNTVNDAIRNTITNIDSRRNWSLLVRDGADTTKMAVAYDSGDGLHENVAGYNLEANDTYTAVTFTKDNSDVTASYSRSLYFDQPVNSYSSPVFNNVSANTFTAFGTNTSGNPSALIQAGARNNVPLVVQHLTPDPTVNLAEFKDNSSNNLIAYSAGLAGGNPIQTISPQATNVGGLLVQAPAGYTGAAIKFLDNTATTLFNVNALGFISTALGIGNSVSSTNAQILLSTTGIQASHNVADANIAFDIQNTQLTATGAILRLRQASTTIATVTATGLGIGQAAPIASLQITKPTNGMGTISTTATGTTVTGVNTLFQNFYRVGQTITANGETRTISAIASNTSMTTDAWTNTNTNIAYTGTSANALIVRQNGVIDATGQINLTGSSTGTVDLNVSNSNAGAASDARLRVGNGTANLEIIMRGTGFTSNANNGFLNLTGTGSLGWLLNGTERARMLTSGNFGIRKTTPLAALHLPAGAATAATGSLIIDAGTDLTTPVAGSIEFDGTDLKYTTSTPTRRVVVNTAATQTITNKTLTTPILTQYTVATLPAGTLGMMAIVTDATAPTYLGALTGGGSVVCPVMFNGTIWVSH